MKNYNGWTNYETWNVMLWLNGIENLYFSMVGMLQSSKTPLTYRELIFALDLNNEITGDRIPFIDASLNYNELNEAIEEIYKNS